MTVMGTAGSYLSVVDQQRYDDIDQRRLACLLLAHQMEAAALWELCDQEIVALQLQEGYAYETHLLLPGGFDQLALQWMRAECLRQKHLILLRWLQLTRRHRLELCTAGFFEAQARIDVDTAIHRFTQEEVHLRPVVANCGYPVQLHLLEYS